MAKIGILGGSFNPPHKAHRAVAEAALEQYGLDAIYLMPAADPPHKDSETLASEAHRTRMVKLLVNSMDSPAVRFSDFELKRGGISYTYVTLTQLKDEHPDDELFFIIGGDSLEAFSEWRNPWIISEKATILVAPRAGIPYDDLEKMCKRYSKIHPGDFYPLKTEKKYENISSTAIRKELMFGEDESKPAGLTGALMRYIRINGLYGVRPLEYETVPDFDEIIKCLRVTLKRKRFKHTIGVANTAKELGHIYSDGSDELADKAYLAGLLHDNSKYYTESEQMALCERFGIPLTRNEWESPALIHAKLGAYLARTRYGVKDEEILNAIRLHTVGRPEMTTLEKIIYIADYIEPGRVIPDAKHPLEELRELVKKDLDKTLVMVIENTVDYLKKSGRVIDEATIKTMDYYTGGEDS